MAKNGKISILLIFSLIFFRIWVLLIIQILVGKSGVLKKFSVFEGPVQVFAKFLQILGIFPVKRGLKRFFFAGGRPKTTRSRGVGSRKMPRPRTDFGIHPGKNPTTQRTFTKGLYVVGWETRIWRGLRWLTSLRVVFGIFVSSKMNQKWLIFEAENRPIFEGKNRQNARISGHFAGNWSAKFPVIWPNLVETLGPFLGGFWSKWSFFWSWVKKGHFWEKTQKGSKVPTKSTFWSIWWAPDLAESDQILLGWGKQILPPTGRSLRGRPGSRKAYRLF